MLPLMGFPLEFCNSSGAQKKLELELPGDAICPLNPESVGCNTVLRTTTVPRFKSF